MIALVDADVLLYRIGWTTENDDESIAKFRVDDLLDSILVETSATEYRLFLSDKNENCFRYHVWSGYKANRVQPRPRHYEYLKQYLIRDWGARIAHEMEADDALGIAQGESTVICSIDKDLLQIPGEHFNFVKKEWQYVTDWAGKQWFYKQILIGDTVDNVRGASGVGPVKAGRALDPIYPEEGEEALYKKVVQVYEKHEKQKTQQEILDHISLVGKLLKIKTTEEEQEWQPPTLKSQPMADNRQSSTPLTPEARTLSTEPTLPDKTSGSSQLGHLSASSQKAETAPST
jgi:5'-3' exonuclease